MYFCNWLGIAQAFFHMQKMEWQPTFLVLILLQKREFHYFSARKKSKYLQKISLPDMFLFQLKIFGSLVSGKETCL